MGWFDIGHGGQWLGEKLGVRIGARKVVVGFVFGRAERGEQASEDPEKGEAVGRPRGPPRCSRIYKYQQLLFIVQCEPIISKP